MRGGVCVAGERVEKGWGEGWRGGRGEGWVGGGGGAEGGGTSLEDTSAACMAVGTRDAEAAPSAAAACGERAGRGEAAL